MTLKLFNILITIKRIKKIKAIVPRGEYGLKVTDILSKKRKVYNPAKDANRTLDGKNFSYFK